MKNILGYAAIGMLALGLASPARADWTWNIDATFYSYYEFGSTTFAANGQDAPDQPWKQWSATLTDPADTGTLSGQITFSDAGVPLSWNFTTTASALGLPAYTDTPLAYTGFAGANYSSAAGSYTGTDWTGIGAGDLWFIDSDGFSTQLDLILPPQLFFGSYNPGDQVFMSALEGPITEGSFGCNYNPYPDIDTAENNYPGCYQEGTFRIESLFTEQGSSLNSVFTFVSGPDNNNSTSTPEPATLALLGSGLIALGVGRRRLAKKA